MARIGALEIRWAQKPEHNGQVKEAMTSRVQDVVDIKEHVKTLACPSCGSAKLVLLSVELGPKGWQAAVICACHSKGILTRNGVHFDLPRVEVST